MLFTKTKLFVAVCLLAQTSLASALQNENQSASEFVDSVYSWGSWELGIEPAAGGPAPMSDRAINVRLSQASFRPNEVTSFVPGASGITVTTPVAPAKLPPSFTPGGAPLPTGTGDLLK